jgi:transcriptional regulator
MYLPETFRLDDRAALLGHVAAHPFATLVTWLKGGTGDPEISHVPLLVAEQAGSVVLRGHVARENPAFAHLSHGSGRGSGSSSWAGGEGCDALAIFHGPHAYVSPSVYGEHPAVPTWNYVVVHARGRARLVTEPELRALLDELVARFDDTGWRFDAPEDYARRMVGAIAGFEIAVDRLEGKWKLSQNRPVEDQHRVARWLEGRAEDGRAVAALMWKRLRG